MRNFKVKFALTLILLFVFGFVSIGAAKEFPSKPIKLIVPFPPGGGHGTLSRAFQVPFEKALKTKVVIECVPGGSTKIGSYKVLKAKPDGYTLLLLVGTMFVGNYYSGTYDSKMWEKLTPLGTIADGPYSMIEVRADSPFTTWKDLVKHAKANPGKLNCGGMGASGMNTLIFNDITQAAGIKCTYVPFGGGGKYTTALLGGHVDFIVCSPSEARAMIKAEKTKGIAISTNQRYKYFPDVPSFKELGIGDGIWLDYCIWGPPKMPKQIADTLADAIKTASEDPKFIKFNEDMLTNNVKFKAGPEIIKGLQKFDKRFGPKLAEFHK